MKNLNGGKRCCVRKLHRLRLPPLYPVWLPSLLRKLYEMLIPLCWSEALWNVLFCVFILSFDGNRKSCSSLTEQVYSSLGTMYKRWKSVRDPVSCNFLRSGSSVENEVWYIVTPALVVNTGILLWNISVSYPSLTSLIPRYHWCVLSFQEFANSV